MTGSGVGASSDYLAANFFNFYYFGLVRINLIQQEVKGLKINLKINMSNQVNICYY